MHQWDCKHLNMFRLVGDLNNRGRNSGIFSKKSICIREARRSALSTAHCSDKLPWLQLQFRSLMAGERRKTITHPNFQYLSLSYKLLKCQRNYRVRIHIRSGNIPLC